MVRLLRDYGMILVLLALCALFGLLTIKEQVPTGEVAVKQLYDQVVATCRPDQGVLVVAGERQEPAAVAEELAERLENAGFTHVRIVLGSPRKLRLALDAVHQHDGPLGALVATGDEVTKWRVVERLPETHPNLADCRLLAPRPFYWPDFLKRSNLLAIVDRIVVIAVIAIGMTMVIITGGIDLSVGSLLALSAVIATTIMKRMGGLEASHGAVLVGFLAGILACGLVAGLGGILVAQFRLPPFITTLGLMMMARGLAFMITGGFSIYQVPKGLAWLGQGRLLGIPNTVLLLLVLYVAAHLFMSHTRLGRYIYAVGGNEQAARLSGVPVKLVIVSVYVVSGLSAGLGGCIQASQLNTGTPNMGMMFELYVIAAVVVGGTSLAGGTGRVFGTLIGAFIISVIQNGMNLLGMESYTQQVVLGGVILAAVLLDRLRSEVGFGKLFGRQFGVEPRKRVVR